MRFIIKGKEVQLTREDIIRVCRSITPKNNAVNRYYISISNINYPIKQVLSLAINLPPAAISTPQAYSILHRLGFEIKSEPKILS